MLSFLKEQERDELLVRGAVDDASAEGGTAQKTASEAEPQQEYLTVASREKQARKSTVLLIVLFGVGLLCLWFMVKKSIPRSATASAVRTEESQIDAARDADPMQNSDSHSRPLAVLSCSACSPADIPQGLRG